MSIITFNGLPVTVGGLAAETAIVALPVGALGRVGSNQGTTTAPAGTVYSIMQAFAPGVVPAGHVVTAAGTTIQAGARASYPDGSLRSAEIRWAHPNAIAPGGSDTILYTIAPGTWDDTPAAPLSAVTAHGYQMQVVIGTVTYTLAFNGLPVTSEGGAVETTFMAKGDFLDPSGAAQGQLWGRFYVAVNASGIRVFGKVYCNKLASAGALAVASYALLDGGTVLFSNSAPFTFYTSSVILCADGEVCEPNSGFDDRRVIWQQDMASLEASAIVLPLLTTPAEIAAFKTVNNPYVPNSIAYYAGGVDATGAAPNIGTISQWDAQALLSGSADAAREARQAAAALLTLGTFWNADFATGLPPVLNNTVYPGLAAPTPNMGWTPNAQPSMTMTGGRLPQSSNGSSHAPHAFWGVYLMSGRRWWRDLLAEQAIGVIGSQNPNTSVYGRNPTINGTKHYALWATFDTCRAVAWEHRNVSNTLLVLPDNDPLRPYFADLIAGHWAATADQIAANASTWGALGIIDTKDWLLSGYFSMANPWMHDYYAMVTALAVLRGELPIDHPFILSHLVKWVWGRGIDGNAYNGFSAYRLGLGIGPAPLTTSTYVQQWSDVYGFGDQPAGDQTPLVGTPPVLSGFSPVNGVWAPGHTYPNLVLDGARAMRWAGVDAVTDYAAKAEAYVVANENATFTEAEYAAGGAQWRIRPLAS